MIGKPGRISHALAAWAIVATWLALAAPAWAQREVRIRALEESPAPFVTTCVAPAARLAAVSDVAGVLVVAHRPGAPAPLSVFRLDDQGQVTADEPVSLALARPAALGDRPNYALGIACHPRFPLLYVWQDVQRPPPETTIDPAASAEFDHLSIFTLDETPPRLLLATARGSDFHCGADAGGFALDAAATRLYAPNMQQPGAMQKPVPAIGWINLAPDGLPVFDDPAVVAGEDPAATAPPPPAAPLSPAEAAASREARMSAIAQAQASGAPLVLSRYLESAVVTFSDWPSPYSYAPISDDAVLLTSYSGPVSWVLSDRLGRFGYFFFTPYIPYRYRMTAHPTLPVAYVSVVAYDGRILCMRHADGYFTLTPQALLLDNVVIHSPPLILTGTQQVVVGAVGKICFADLNAEGRFKATGSQMTVNNPQVEALTWSERFGRLYVPVETTP